MPRPTSCRAVRNSRSTAVVPPAAAERGPTEHGHGEVVLLLRDGERGERDVHRAALDELVGGRQAGHAAPQDRDATPWSRPAPR